MHRYNAIRVLEPEDITLKYLPYKYPMRSAMTLKAELRQIAYAVSKGVPRLELQPIKDEWLSIVGFGPSLNETWKDITRPCITTSGAHDFLLSKGFTPDYHAQCDGRDHQERFLRNPQKEITYLMASICCPAIWDRLEGFNVRLWHNAHGDHVVKWIGANDPGSILIAGGSNIGLSSIHVGGILGYRKFKIFGFDGNFRGKTRHAGKHYDPLPQTMIERNGWVTSPQMSNACDEFVSLSKNPELEFEVFGTSLLTSLL